MEQMKRHFCCTVVLLFMAYGLFVPHATLDEMQFIGIDKKSSSISASEEQVRSSSDKMCVSANPGLRELINSTSRVMIMMAAKSAGTTAIKFAQRCTGKIQPEMASDWEDAFVDSYELPSVMAQHEFDPWQMEKTLRGASRQTLVVWLHREENSRVISAIHHNMKFVCEQIHIGGDIRIEQHSLVKYENGQCTVLEDDLINKMIKPKVGEIELGNGKLLTCRTYETIKNNAPTMVFADYKQSDKLMVEIARKHCPHMMDEEPLHLNTQHRFENKLFVKLSREHNSTAVWNHTVPLEDWLVKKGDFLEYLLNLKKGFSCQATTRRMEDAIESCGDHIIRIDDDWIG